MKILYITNKPIFPVVDGGCKAMHQLLFCLLQSDLELKHICLSTHKHPFDISYYPESLQKSFPIVSFPINTKLKYSEALKHIINRKSYNISRFDCQDIHHKIHLELNEGNYTHVFLESLYLSPYISTIRKYSNAKIILRTHNVEHIIWEQLAQNTSNPLKKWYLNRLALDLKKQELAVLNKVDLIASISDTDTFEFKKIGISAPIMTLPVAMDTQENKIDYKSQDLFFLGSMNWQPNLEAVQWLIQEIFPVIKYRMPEIRLHIAGSFMLDKFPTNEVTGIVNHGFVEDSTLFMQSNGILVLPILSGSGVRMKMLEAMSLGIPVITTNIGAQGINDLNTISIANNTDEFIEKIMELLQSKEKRSVLGNKAFIYMEKNYSVSTISTLICERIRKL